MVSIYESFSIQSLNERAPHFKACVPSREAVCTIFIMVFGDPGNGKSRKKRRKKCCPFFIVLYLIVLIWLLVLDHVTVFVSNQATTKS